MPDETPVRTGEEKTIKDDLNKVDNEVGNNIDDKPGGNRDEDRRSKYIDLHGDEDNDPNTSESTYKQQK